MKRSFWPLILFIFMLAFSARTGIGQPADEIPGGPPVKMLQDFNEMFPDEDFYEMPSKEIKDQFIQKYPLWGLVIRRIEKDDEKRMKAEEFFDTHGEYPTAENHGEVPFSNYLLDYLEYEKEDALPPAETTDLPAEIRSLFPAWDGKEITLAMEEKFNRHFSNRSFGSWNPLFYGELFEDSTYLDEDVDEGLIYEEDESESEFPDENWLMQETVGTSSPDSTLSPTKKS